MVGKAAHEQQRDLRQVAGAEPQKIKSTRYDSGGRGRKNWMMKLMAASAMRLSPIHKAEAGTPSIAAAAKPARHRPSAWPECSAPALVSR